MWMASLDHTCVPVSRDQSTSPGPKQERAPFHLRVLRSPTIECESYISFTSLNSLFYRTPCFTDDTLPHSHVIL